MMISCRILTFVLLLLSLSALLSACADVPTAPDEYAQFKANNDPMEPMNRAIFDVNDFLDQLLIRPLAELYRFTIPSVLRDRISGIVLNMKEPVIFVNNVLQGEFGRAGTTLERFGLNTTIGVGGMWDVAGKWEGLYQQTGDFGQTLYVWGFNDGPYTVLPIFGPSSMRDKIGLAVDLLLSPWQYLAYIEGGPAAFAYFEVASLGADRIIKREKNIESLDALQQGSLDYYAEIRSVYRQYRAKQIGSEPAQALPKYEDNE
jgi:phospholipid-binding lipoprotein MlaA